MPTPRTPETLLAAARLYYVQGRSQAEVAEALGTSRSNVSRMLAEAQRQGIVEIRVNDPGGRVHELEEQVRQQFGLRDVRIAYSAPTPGLRVEDQVGVQDQVSVDVIAPTEAVARAVGAVGGGREAGRLGGDAARRTAEDPAGDRGAQGR